jgi:hypothetical protein
MGRLVFSNGGMLLADIPGPSQPAPATPPAIPSPPPRSTDADRCVTPGEAARLLGLGPENVGVVREILDSLDVPRLLGYPRADVLRVLPEVEQMWRDGTLRRTDSPPETGE